MITKNSTRHTGFLKIRGINRVLAALMLMASAITASYWGDATAGALSGLRKAAKKQEATQDAIQEAYRKKILNPMHKYLHHQQVIARAVSHSDWAKKVLATIEETRAQELQKLADTKGTLAALAWGFASGSAGAAAIPGVSVVTGIAADIALTVSWLVLVKNRYGATEVDCLKLAGRATIDEGIKSGSLMMVRKLQSKWIGRALERAARRAGERVARAVGEFEGGAFEAGTAEGREAAEAFWKPIAEEYVATVVEAQKDAARLEAGPVEDICRDTASYFPKRSNIKGMLRRQMGVEKRVRFSGEDHTIYYVENTTRDKVIKELEEHGADNIMTHLRTGDGLTQVTIEQFNDSAAHITQTAEREMANAAEGQAAHVIEGTLERACTEEVARRAEQAAAMASREYAEKLVARYSAEEGAKEGLEWVPIAGQIIGAGLALGMMRDLCGQFNITYYDGAVANTNETYDAKADVVKAIAMAEQAAVKKNQHHKK